MKLTKIVMKNWCSFFGRHELDFEKEEETSSYVIFGQIGKGKSSVVAAVEWAMFGKVMDSMQDGDDHILRQKRPIIDAEQFNGEFNKFALPLLVDRAYREGDYCTEVELYFIHDGSECKLIRKAKPLNEEIPFTDSDMNIHLSLSIGSQEYENECPAEKIFDDIIVQPRINEIIPEEVSRFFFVKGDSIREFTGLIFGSDNNPKMKDAVNSVVGLPALTRSLSDFRQLRSKSEEEANRYARLASTGNDIDDQIQGTLLEIEALEKGQGEGEDRMLGIEQLEADVTRFEAEISSLEEDLAKHDEARNLLSKKHAFEEEMKNLDKNNPKHFKAYKTALEDGWKIIIQKTINDSMQSLEKRAKKETEIKQDINILSKDIPHDLERLNSKDGAIPCDRCDAIRPALSEAERIALDDSIKERKEEIRTLEYDLESYQGSGEKKNALYEFKTDINSNAIAQSESLIRVNLSRYEELEGFVNDCKAALLDMDTDGYEEIQNKLKDTQHFSQPVIERPNKR